MGSKEDAGLGSRSIASAMPEETGGRSSLRTDVIVPRDVDQLLRLEGIEVWLFSPRDSLYKVYTHDEAIMKVLMNTPKKLGLRRCATYSREGRTFGRDFIVSYSQLHAVLELVRRSTKTKK